MITSSFAAIIPELGLVVLAGLLLVFDVVWKGPRCRQFGWIASLGLLLLMGVSITISKPPAEGMLIWGGMLSLDTTGFVFRLIFLAGASLTALFAMDSEAVCNHGMFYVMLVASTLGMCLMASSADMVMLYLAIELTALPLYVLAGFRTDDEKSVESGIKFFLFGAMASAVMLYGFSLLYGFSGSTNLYLLADAFLMNEVPKGMIFLALFLVLAGLFFKISAVPFHFWAPDVYEGAPTSVAGFLSTASKAAGFVVILRMLLVVFPAGSETWQNLLVVISILSMTIGNLLALVQKNIKRMLAYSSIAQAGYILIGVAANNELGSSGVVYYLVSYLVTNLAAFGIVSTVNMATGSDEIGTYSGLSRRSPILALALLACLLSLGGIPPFAGFIGKFLVFASAMSRGMIALVIIALLNSVISLYYYLNVLKVVYMGRSEREEEYLKVPLTRLLGLAVTSILVLLLGVITAPLFALSVQASKALLLH